MEDIENRIIYRKDFYIADAFFIFSTYKKNDCYYRISLYTSDIAFVL